MATGQTAARSEYEVAIGDWWNGSEENGSD
jgi:hypothetical protein